MQISRYALVDYLDTVQCPMKARWNGTHGIFHGECYGCKVTLEEFAKRYGWELM